MTAEHSTTPHPPAGEPLLVADIGGTNARLALARAEGETVALDAVAVYPCADFPNLPALLEHYLATLPGCPRQACLALAGPGGELCRLTNSGWVADRAALLERFGFDGLRLVNDFGALARGIPGLPAAESRTLWEGRADPAGPVSVIGPGTGFGVALLLPGPGGWRVVPTEGGHARFTPATPEELAVWQALGGLDQHVCVEYLLSGAGIARIHAALAPDEPPLAAAEISRRALAGSDPVCVETLALFCGALGAVAGDIALIHGARGGLWLGGGILPKIAPLLRASSFHQRFRDKGAMRGFVEPLPVRLVDSDRAALRGAALWYRQQGQL